jgi:hypothetical protein
MLNCLTHTYIHTYVHTQVTYSPICTGEKFRIGHVGPHKGGKSESTSHWLSRCAHLESGNTQTHNRSPLLERIYGPSRRLDDDRAPANTNRAPGINLSKISGDNSEDTGGIALFNGSHTHSSMAADPHNSDQNNDNHYSTPRGDSSGAGLPSGAGTSGGIGIAQNSTDKNGGKHANYNDAQSAHVNSKKCVVVGIQMRKLTPAATVLSPICIDR